MSTKQMNAGEVKRTSSKLNIKDRFNERSQAERYRDRYKKKRLKTHEREINALQELLRSLHPIKEIIDVASGPGRFAPLLAEHSTRLIQADTSKHMLDLSREDYPLASPYNSYIQADAGSLPLVDGCVDLVFSHRFLNHVLESSARLRIFREMARITRQYVVVSCLGLPAFIYVLRASYLRILRPSAVQEYVKVPDLVQDAVAAGLVLKSRKQIRSFPSSAVYLIFAKR